MKRHGRCSPARTMSSHAKVLRPALESGLIEYVCQAHAPAEHGPTVTPLHGSWSYCPGFDERGHVWRQIRPVTRERLERFILLKRVNGGSAPARARAPARSRPSG